MKVTDFDGTVLDATFSVERLKDGEVSLVYESSGGRAGGPNPRNLDYRRGLRALLERLKKMDAVLIDLRVETERTRKLSAEEQRVALYELPYPFRLASVPNVDDLRKEISRAARRVGQDPDKLSRPGGSSRRLRFVLGGLPSDPAALERELGSGSASE